MSYDQNEAKITAIKGLQPLVGAAMTAAGFTVPTGFQRRMLTHLAEAQCPDMIAETSTGSGRYVCIAATSAHCVLCATGANKTVIIMCQTFATVTKVKAIFGQLAVHGLRVQALDPESAVRAGTGGDAAHVYIGTMTAVAKLSASVLGRCVALVVEDVAAVAAHRVVDVLETFVREAPMLSICLFSSAAPDTVDMSVRYLLRRSNRRYIFADPAPGAAFTTLLCHSQSDRSDLCMRIAEMPGLRRVLILTHNKEVRDLKNFLHSAVGLRTYSIQRSTPAAERQTVLGDFLSCQFAVLVAMDAFAGVDLTDVDAVIQFYPPQKSMPEEEWSVYVACLQSTGQPQRPCRVVTIGAPDDLTMISYFQNKTGVAGPVLNISPTHVQFAELVRNPQAALEAKGTEAHINGSATGVKQLSPVVVGAGVPGGGGALPVPASKQQRGGRNDEEDDDDKTRRYYWSGGKKIYK
jgi:hypothetical protein